VSPPRPGVLRLTVNGRSVSNPQWFPGQIVNGLPTPLSGTAAATANKHWEDLEKFPTIVARLAGMVDRFTSMLDCVDVAFLPDGILDQLPTPSQIGATRTGGLDINKPRTRAALSAVLALAVSPDGFTVADLAAKVHTLTGQSKDDYTVRQAAYDLRKLRGKQFVVKPGPIRRYPYGVPLAAQARQQLSGRNGPGGGPPGCNTATTNAGRLIERCRMRPAPRRNRGGDGIRLCTRSAGGGVLVTAAVGTSAGVPIPTPRGRPSWRGLITRRRAVLSATDPRR